MNPQTYPEPAPPEAGKALVSARGGARVGSRWRSCPLAVALVSACGGARVRSRWRSCPLAVALVSARGGGDACGAAATDALYTASTCIAPVRLERRPSGCVAAASALIGSIACRCLSTRVNHGRLSARVVNRSCIDLNAHTTPLSAQIAE